MDRTNKLCLLLVIVLFGGLIALVYYFEDQSNETHLSTHIGTSRFGDPEVVTQTTCGHETEIYDLKAEIEKLTRERDAGRAAMEQLAAQNTRLIKERTELETKNIALEKANAMMPQEVGVVCPRTGISVEDQSKATAVFDGVMQGVSHEDIENGANAPERTQKAFQALAVIWGGEEKLKKAIVAAKQAVIDDLGPPPYTYKGHSDWSAKKENKFAALLFNWFGHLP